MKEKKASVTSLGRALLVFKRHPWALGKLLTSAKEENCIHGSEQRTPLCRPSPDGVRPQPANPSRIPQRALATAVVSMGSGHGRWSPLGWHAGDVTSAGFRGGGGPYFQQHCLTGTPIC